MDGIRFADDEVDSAKDKTLVDETLFGEAHPITWILQ